MISGLAGIGGSGGGLSAVEARMQQIEGLIAGIEAKRAAALNPSAAGLNQGAASLNPQSAELGTIKLPAQFPTNPVTGESLPKPFQFYLQKTDTMQPATSGQSLESLVKRPASVNQMQRSTTLPQGLNIALTKDSIEQRAQAYQPMIEGLSAKYGVDKDLINALVRQESGFNPNAHSGAGAIGLMQLMPATARGLGVNNPQHPAQNLDGGVRYLKTMIDQFNGNIPLALAAYNAGPNAVTRHKGIPPYKETQNYVRTILSNFLKSKQEHA